MELAGNEKKIQALFRDLKIADERVAPRFVTMWNRAQAMPQGSTRGLKPSFAVAICLVVIALFSLWSRNWERIQRSTPAAVSVLQQAESTMVPSVAPVSPQLVIAEPLDRAKVHRPRRQLAVRHQTDRDANTDIAEAVAISSWQSPTTILLQSPANDMLTTLPQLDLSVKDLKTFLPDTLQ
ncbi:MAG TPA: hypothetical protein DC047_00365 [Blastocatellia bacterium]|nr:hypothetical protein [Blastocatellia bacterium]